MVSVNYQADRIWTLLVSWHTCGWLSWFHSLRWEDSPAVGGTIPWLGFWTMPMKERALKQQASAPLRFLVWVWCDQHLEVPATFTFPELWTKISPFSLKLLSSVLYPSNMKRIEPVFIPTGSTTEQFSWSDFNLIWVQSIIIQKGYFDTDTQREDPRRQWPRSPGKDLRINLYWHRDLRLQPPELQKNEFLLFSFRTVASLLN